MATISQEVLEIALANGDIAPDKTSDYQQVESMNTLLGWIQRNPNITSFQLKRLMDFNHSTVLTYCQWLAKSGLIEITHIGQGGVCQYRALSRQTP